MASKGTRCGAMYVIATLINGRWGVPARVSGQNGILAVTRFKWRAEELVAQLQIAHNLKPGEAVIWKIELASSDELKATVCGPELIAQ